MIPQPWKARHKLWLEEETAAYAAREVPSWLVAKAEEAIRRAMTPEWGWRWVFRGGGE